MSSGGPIYKSSRGFRKGQSLGDTLNVCLESLLRVINMDWRLEVPALLAGVVLAGIPLWLYPDFGLDTSQVSTSWGTIVSNMEYVLIIGIVLAVLGMILRGHLGEKSAKILICASILVGIWLGFSMIVVGITITFVVPRCCPLLIPVVTSARNLLAIGLLIPTMTFVSSMFWIIREH